MPKTRVHFLSSLFFVMVSSGVGWAQGVITLPETVGGMELVFVKGGCYEMGCGSWTSDCRDDEKPAHEVCVNDLYMGKYEVRVADFRKFTNETSYRTEAEKEYGCVVWVGKELKIDPSKNWRDPGFLQSEEHPVVCVSHNDASEYVQWLGKKTGKKYRLPTEAEWEYAARSGGKKYKYSWGNGSPSGNIADESFKRQLSSVTIWAGYDDGYVFTAPVGRFTRNELGLYDMTGNVLEWCQDWHDKDYYKNSPRNNPEGPPSGQDRVLRGGSWFNDARNLRASDRLRSLPAYRFNYGGFRLVLSPR
jgi:sulfatase modifying factor 1